MERCYSHRVGGDLTNARIYSGTNPSEMYFQSLIDLLENGKELAPRGKRVMEIRLVTFEFLNPQNQVTFLKGRSINPFFQLAEVLWILEGRSDVAWLKRWNSNMAQFSDDGVTFNAPYGERLLSYNKNDYRGFIFNPINQIAEVINKLQDDTDTRQALAIMWNPMFDGYYYTNIGKGKDIPCNLVLDFKIRDGKLDLTVFNRSNDIHWGLFGANLAQFTFIQKFVAAALKVPVGVYYHVTNSLHVYLDDYSSSITGKLMDNYKYQVTGVNGLTEEGYNWPGETRAFLKYPSIDMVISDISEFEEDSQVFWSLIAPTLASSNFNRDITMSMRSSSMVASALKLKTPIFKDTTLLLMAYAAVTNVTDNKLLCGHAAIIQECFASLSRTQWSLACTKMIYSKIQKMDTVDFILDIEYVLDVPGWSDEAIAYIKGE